MSASRSERLGAALQGAARYVFITLAVAIAFGAAISPLVFLLRRLGVG